MYVDAGDNKETRSNEPNLFEGFGVGDQVFEYGEYPSLPTPVEELRAMVRLPSLPVGVALVGDDDGAPPPPGFRKFWGMLCQTSLPRSAVGGDDGLAVGGGVDAPSPPPPVDETNVGTGRSSPSLFPTDACKLQHTSKYCPRKLRHRSDPSVISWDEKNHPNCPQVISFPSKLTR
eukprot:CAMPEP_0183763050 /NCGR_PEP_ID=MMETSP0739-20130205/9442_1 /TAXON_ID=385413 /ORGANISM="Thalassiosira miniscula, Strain CCMP1093" /LENGTH=174 /DNA_ID=CAMNT_0026001403 /DNA_START=41 /DNA_END=565 /DNA_ORIENTATION=-